MAKKSVIERAKQKPLKTKATFSIDNELLEKLKQKCDKDNVPVSRVIEILIKDFVE